MAFYGSVFLNKLPHAYPAEMEISGTLEKGIFIPFRYNPITVDNQYVTLHFYLRSYIPVKDGKRVLTMMNRYQSKEERLQAEEMFRSRVKQCIGSVTLRKDGDSIYSDKNILNNLDSI